MTVKRVLGVYLIWLSVWTISTLGIYLGIVFGNPDGSYLVMLNVAAPTMFSLTLDSAYKRYAFFLVTRVDRKQLALFRLAVCYVHFFVYALLDLLLLLAGVEVFAFAYTALGLNVFSSSVCVAARSADERSKTLDIFGVVVWIVVILSFALPYFYMLWNMTMQALILSTAIILCLGVACATAAGVALYRRRERLSYA